MARLPVLQGEAPEHGIDSVDHEPHRRHQHPPFGIAEPSGHRSGAQVARMDTWERQGIRPTHSECRASARHAMRGPNWRRRASSVGAIAPHGWRRTRRLRALRMTDSVHAGRSRCVRRVRASPPERVQSKQGPPQPSTNGASSCQATSSKRQRSGNPLRRKRPRSRNWRSFAAPTIARTVSEARIWPPAALAQIRAAASTVEPKMSPSSRMASPAFRPTRTWTRCSGGFAPVFDLFVRRLFLLLIGSPFLG